MSTAMTIFCHGTKSYSDEVSVKDDGMEFGQAEKELVWFLEKHYQLPRDLQGDTLNGGKLLLHGVGSVNAPTSNRVTQTPEGLQGIHTPTGKGAMMFNQAIGNGIGENIHKAVTFLEYMVDNNKRPSCINMVGWSRGGVTCIRLAQTLHENGKLRDIPVNIFAGDPVPGFGRHQSFLSTSKRYSITPNVKKYLQVMAMHVTGWSGLRGSAFKPMLPTIVDGGQTVVHAVLPLPGDHGPVVQAGKGKSGQITIDMAIRFLRACGSSGVDVETISEARLSTKKIYDYYEGLSRSIREHDGAFPKPKVLERELSLGGAFKHALFPTHDRRRDAGAAGGKYMILNEFVNEHHQYLSERFNRDRPGAAINTTLRTLFDMMYA